MPFDDMRDKMIPQPDPIAAMQPQYVKNFAVYDVSNPHPGFGKDPNILNEFGHTLYPKFVTKANGDKVIVNTKAEEDEVLGHSADKLKDNGPTISEYVAAGFDPATYPPKGYASKNTKEEVKEFIKKHNKTGW